MSLVTAEIATIAFTFFCMWAAVKFLVGVAVIRPLFRFLLRSLRICASQMWMAPKLLFIALDNAVFFIQGIFLQRKSSDSIDEENGKSE